MMKIKDTRTKDTAPFDTIPVGSVFIWNGNFCMKTQLCMIVSGAFCNAVNITDGTFLTFENRDSVEKLNTELIIRQ